MATDFNEIPNETLLAWKNGNVKAFEEIVRMTMKRAYAVALGLVGNMEDAKDLSQEAFIAAHRARRTFDAGKPFFPWFYRILRNRCLNFLRSKARKREISMDVLVERECTDDSPDAVLLKKENIEALWKALFTLSPEHREIIVLRMFHELSYKEIAATLGISDGTVMSRLFYARKALCGVLRETCSELYGEEVDAP